jgi:hypothetical protein
LIVCYCLSDGGVTTLAVDPSRTGTVYATLTQGGIYKNNKLGTDLDPLHLRRATLRHTAAVDPAPPTTIYAGQSQGPQILRSTDSGRTWATAP